MTQKNLKTPASAFDNLFSPSVNPWNATWSEFIEVLTSPHPIVHAEKEHLPAFNAWRYKLPSDPTVSAGTDKNGRPLKWFSTTHTRRIADNALAMSMLVLDFDGGLPLAEAQNRFAEFEHVGYTSFNHGVDGIDKHRCVLPLTTPLTVSEYRKLKSGIQSWIESDGVTKADPTTYTIGQIFILPAVRPEHQHMAVSWHNPGKLLDPKYFEESLQTVVSRAAVTRQAVVQTNRLELMPSMWLETARGSVKVDEIDRKIPYVRCPFHADAKPTEFAAATARGLPYLVCKKCGTVYMSRSWKSAEDPIATGIAKIKAKKGSE